MTQRQSRWTTTTQSITLNSVLFTRQVILVMDNGISNAMIIRALVYLQINVELVTNERATRFDEVKIDEGLN